MTYFEFLAVFLFIPVLTLLFISRHDERIAKAIVGFTNRPTFWLAIMLQTVVAVFYTTPWDNYLVASNVWYYDPTLVTGKVIGYVPIEEYTFFIVETIMIGLWWLFLARRITSSPALVPSKWARVASGLFLIPLWITSLGFLIMGQSQARYLTIILAWALPPIMIQLWYGADIIWKHRRLALLTIIPMTIYLCLADSLAITSGTWTISSTQSIGLFLGSLPIEEALFFLLTSILISFGMTLLLADESSERYKKILTQLKELKTRQLIWFI